MKKLLTILFILSAYISYGQQFDFYTRYGFYKRMTVYDSTAIRNLINGKADTGSVGGVSSVTGDLVDNTDPLNPIVGLSGSHTLLGSGIINAATHVFSVNSGSAVLFSTQNNKGLFIDDNDDISVIQYDINNRVELTSLGSAFTGNVKLNTVPSGALTDSILTWDASTKIVNRRDISSFGFGTVTSVARTNGLGITASVANQTTTPNITIAVDTSSASILSRQRAALTYAPISINGTVTSVSVTTANGVSATVATATTTPAISLTLGAITPTTVNGNTFTTGSSTYTGTAAMTYIFPDTSATIPSMAKVISKVNTDTTTLTVQKDVSELTVYARANKKYEIKVMLHTQCSATGGYRIALNGPASSTINGIAAGTSTSNSAINENQMRTIGTLTAAGSFAYQRVANATGSLLITAVVTTSGTAGAFAVQWAAATLGETSTILTGSWIKIQEVL